MWWKGGGEGRAWYLQSERRTAGGNGRRLRAERERPPDTAGDEWQQSWAQYQPHPDTVHSDCSVRPGQRGEKIQLFELNLCWSFRGVCLLGFCLAGFSVGPPWVRTDGTVRQRGGVRRVVKWYRRFFYTSRLSCWRPSQKIVGYWLLGGDAPGLLRRRFEDDELPL